MFSQSQDSRCGTCDFGKEEEKGYDGEASAVFVSDDATDLRDMAPVPDKSADEAEFAAKTFAGGGGEVCVPR